MSYFELWAVSALAVWVYVTLIWLASVALRNASIVDIFWGPGFVLIAAIACALGDGFLGRRLLITALAAVWGLRLGAHIARRNHGKGEDYRYQAFRQQYGPDRYWWFSYFQVFLLQGALMLLIAPPLIAAQSSATPDHFTVLDAIGAVVWGVGFFFETVGDWQLDRFKRNPANAGKVMDRGLWSLTRHPNYFGDATVWWGYYAIALGTGWGALTIFGPALMTYLIVYVSGVALLERHMRDTPKYADYMRRTSAFFPRPPKPR
jgi:steroid 5-alpha reductase family enzyme